MSYQEYRYKRFRAEALQRIDECNAILDDYQAQGLRLTLRQLYYQLVTKNTIPNSEKSYKALGGLVSDARLAGKMDWDAIEDRVRRPRILEDFSSLKEMLEQNLRTYRLQRWEGQENYVELWVEKDALAGVLSPICDQFHVTLMVNRGYSSSSAMYEASQRFMYKLDSQEGCQTLHLLYLGDHDPSGEDMVRDIEDRLNMFDCSVYVKKIALTTEQVHRYNPPPNPAKLTDSRARTYIAKHGRSSWEVDAIPPQELQKIVRGEIRELLDEDLMNKVIAREKVHKAALLKVAEKME